MQIIQPIVTRRRLVGSRCVSQYSDYFTFWQDLSIIERQKQGLADGECGSTRDICYH